MNESILLRDDLCDLDPWYGDSLLLIWNFEAGYMDATIKTVIGTMPFNVNRRHWLALSAWDKKQAALLVLGIEPGEFHHIDSHSDYLSMCKPLIQLMQLMPDNLTKPLDWLTWFDGNGYMECAPPWLCRWFKEQSETMSNIDAETPPPTQRKNQLFIFIWRVHQALAEKKRPTAQVLWNEIQHRHNIHDTDGIIQEVNAGNISWCSGYGNEQNQSRATFDKTLSNIRKAQPF